ncbi:MAG: hypothetical protein V9G19_08650 [Tetrasphaera sp.]
MPGSPPPCRNAHCVALLRLRFKLTVHGRRDRLLLAEEAALVALQGNRIIATGDEVRAWLGQPAAAELAAAARDRLIGQAHQALATLIPGPLADHARTRAAALLEDHGRLRATLGITRVSVDPALPPDVIGLFTLLPAED